MTHESLYISPQSEHSPSIGSCPDNASLYSSSTNSSQDDLNDIPEKIDCWKESVSCHMQEAQSLLSTLEKEIDDCTGCALFGVVGLGGKLARIGEHVAAADDLLEEKMRDSNGIDSAIGEVVKDRKRIRFQMRRIVGKLEEKNVFFLY